MPDETAEPMSDNAALNAIVEELESIEDHLTGEYDSITGDTTWRDVTDEKSSARTAEPLAIKTTVTNKGPSPVRVFEDGILVIIVPVGETEALPLSGKGVIQWECQTGQESEAALATYRKTA